jgi:flagellar hook protein FlgE
VTQEGGFIMGWGADAAGNVNTNAGIGQLEIPVGDLDAPNATNRVSIGGNLPADAEDGDDHRQLGRDLRRAGQPLDLSVRFRRPATTPGSVESTTSTPTPASSPGSLHSGRHADLRPRRRAHERLRGFDVTTGLPPTFTGDLRAVRLGSEGGPNRLTQYGELSTVAILEPERFGGRHAPVVHGLPGRPGRRFVLQRPHQGHRPDRPGLLRQPRGSREGRRLELPGHDELGLAQVGTAGAGGRGLLSTGTLEMSNVDLAQEFTNLIVSQRGFQANSRVVTTSDELLQEVVNLKR